MNIEKEFKKFLRKWVKEMYGQSEADDPSWSIEALAHDLREEYWNIRERHELENIKDDVFAVACDNNIVLDDQQVADIADDYRYSESYCAKDNESIKYFIKHYLGEE